MTVAGKVSVLVTTYNHAAFVEDTLRSVLDQTYRNLQIVVADDGSTDGTPAVITRLAEGDAGRRILRRR